MINSLILPTVISTSRALGVVGLCVNYQAFNCVMLKTLTYVTEIA